MWVRMLTRASLVGAKEDVGARTVVESKNDSTILGWSRWHSTVALVHVHGMSSPKEPYVGLPCTLPSSIAMPGVTRNSTTAGLVIVLVVPALHPHGTLLIGEGVGDDVVGASVGDDVVGVSVGDDVVGVSVGDCVGDDVVGVAVGESVHSGIVTLHTHSTSSPFPVQLVYVALRGAQAMVLSDGPGCGSIELWQSDPSLKRKFTVVPPYPVWHCV
jgi:hypothetical protein